MGPAAQITPLQGLFVLKGEQRWWAGRAGAAGPPERGGPARPAPALGCAGTARRVLARRPAAHGARTLRPCGGTRGSSGSDRWHTAPAVRSAGAWEPDASTTCSPLRTKSPFRIAVRKFVSDLRTGRLRRGLRVKAIRGTEGVFEMTGHPTDGQPSRTARRSAPAIHITSGGPWVCMTSSSAHNRPAATPGRGRTGGRRRPSPSRPAPRCVSRTWARSPGTRRARGRRRRGRCRPGPLATRAGR